tara:strand:+ start:406 stop:711 length:306 start_codon:yes stop_codon:yes gene_type:complete
MATWTIANLERNLSDGGVTVAHWRVTESETVGDDTFTASTYGTVGFTPDVDDPSFVPYDSLTEADVMAWVWAEVDQATTEAALTTKIEADKNPVTGSGMPW